MKLLKVADGKYVNTDRITYIEAKRSDKVIIMFQNEVSAGGIGVPKSYVELKGPDAEEFIRWLEKNADSIGNM